MDKILILGQAPPAITQQLPYDTTMLYDWLAEIGVSKERAQQIFEFESCLNFFPGRNNTNSGHKRPTKKQIAEHWITVEERLQQASKVIILGGVAAGYYNTAQRTWSCTLPELFLIHPSRRNTLRYRENKTEILNSLRAFIFD